MTRRRPKALKDTPAKPRKGKSTTLRPVTARSAVTNGRLLLGVMDKRTTYVRRFGDLIAQYTLDLGGDVTTGQASIVRRVSALQVELEARESAFLAAGGASDRALDAYGRASGTLARLLDRLGLERVAIDVTPGRRAAGRVNGRRRAGAYSSDLELLDEAIRRGEDA